LVTAAVNGSTTATISYDYDGLGRRVMKTVGGVVTQYLLDGDEEIAELDGSGNLLRRYITGPAVDDRIARAEGSATSNPTKYYYHTNHQGSVLASTDASGNPIQQIAYDEYGNSASAATGEPFRYTGRRFDPETGLYYYRARYYSPTLGRFLQADPVGYRDDLNLYAYTGNDPLNGTDSSGKSDCTATGFATMRCTSEPGLDHLFLHIWLWWNGYTAKSESHGDTDQTAASSSPSSEAPVPSSDGTTVPNTSQGQGTSSEDKPSLLDPRGSQHVLDGEPNGGGGHRSGTGRSGKSEFPNNWSDEKIEGEISDVVTDPQTQWSKPDSRGYISGSGTRDGVEIKVVYDTKTGRIVTGYPTNTPRNP
jgi:RHS repeat-associated protein